MEEEITGATKGKELSVRKLDDSNIDDKKCSGDVDREPFVDISCTLLTRVQGDDLRGGKI